MEQKLPYEQHLSEQWINLPLPNEDTCWADMKKRLDEDDDDRPIIFWWRRGCGLWGLLFVALVSIGWWAYEYYSPKQLAPAPIQSVQHNAIEKTHSSESGENKSDKTSTEKKSIQDELKQPINSRINPSELESREAVVSSETNSLQPVTQTESVKKGGLSKEEIHLPPKVKGFRSKQSKKSERTKVVKPGIVSYEQINKETRGTASSNIEVSNKPNDANLKGLESVAFKSETVDSVVNPLKDTVHKPDLAIKKDTTNSKKNPPKVDSTKKSSYFFSSGLSIHQQIPTAGQSFTPYNSLGRKGSLADYIPAPYIRFTKKDKWFVQAEFRYGAPVYGKSFIYDQNQSVDTFNNQVITNSLRLKKSFYHQVPVSFHFTVKEGFTIGTGLVWNRFQGAIAEQELISRNRSTGVETVLSKGIIKDSSAQSFTKSFFQAHIETQYQWKRLQFGARYNFGLQPFIKFSLPGLGEQSRTSNNLQVFFRYQIWRSKRPEQH